MLPLFHHLYARRGIKLGLATMQALIGQLGTLPFKKIIVGGTNGKGSVSSYLAKALEYDGYRVGLFTSPHLLKLGERIQINGAIASDKDLIRWYERLCALPNSQSASFFECITLMALIAFQEQQVDVAVLEVGLGGRLDATNSIQDKTLSIITSIGLDHQEYLGNTLQKIAVEKAHILPPNGFGVLGFIEGEALESIEHFAHAQKTTLDKTNYVSDYVQQNQATVRTAWKRLKTLNFKCSDEALEQVFQTHQWIGRYHVLENQGVRVLLDGAHNAHGMAAFLNKLANDPNLSGEPVHAIVSIVQGKNIDEMLTLLKQHCTSISFCSVRSERSRTNIEFEQICTEHRLRDSITIYISENFEEAYQHAHAEQIKHGGIVIVVGSLFLIADALHVLTGAERDAPIDG